MAFVTKQPDGWQIGRIGGTPITAAALNDLESRIADAVSDAEGGGPQRIGYLSLADYCTLDGSTDDSAGFASAWAAALAENKQLIHPGGSLKLASQITGRASMSLRGVDATTCEIIQADTSSDHHLFDLGGYSTSITNPQLLTSNVTKGTRTIPVTDASGYAVGDTLVLLSDKLWLWSDKDSVQGELVRIASKASNTLTLREPIDDTYLTADGALTRKLNVLEGFHLEGVTIRNASPATHTNGAIRLRGYRDITIKDVIFKDLDGYGVMLNTCEDFNVDHAHFYDLNDNATEGRYTYGVVAYNATQKGRVENCLMSGGRHLFTTGSDIGQDTTGAGGIPRHITVAHCQATRMTNTCFDSHPEGDQIDFFDCHAFQTLAWGFALRSPNGSATACTVNENLGYAFWLRGDNNKLHGCASRRPRTGTIISTDGDPGASYDGQGLRIGEGPTINPDDCEIRGFSAEDPDADGVYIGNACDRHYFNGLVVRRPGRAGSNTNGVRFSGTTAGHRFISPAFYNAAIAWFGAGTATDIKVDSPHYETVTQLTSGGVVLTVRGDVAPSNGQAGMIAPSAEGWSAGSTGLVANGAYLMRFVPSRAINATKLAFAVSTASGADDAFDVGIYDSALTRLVSSGAKTSASGGLTGGGMNSLGVKVVDITETFLKGGTTYYAAFSAAAAGATLRAATFGSDYATQLFGTAVGSGEAFFKSSSHVLPSSIATPTVSSLVPVIAVRES
jgi:hypothetical protein